MGYGGESALEK